MNQAVQFAGALLILAPFVGQQLGRMRAQSRPYLWLNLVGSAVLAFAAFEASQWGFVFIETVWSSATLWTLIQELGRQTEV